MAKYSCNPQVVRLVMRFQSSLRLSAAGFSQRREGATTRWAMMAGAVCSEAIVRGCKTMCLY